MAKSNKKFNSKKKFSKRGKTKFNKDEEAYVDKSEVKEEKYNFRNHPSDFIPDEEIRRQVGSFSFNNTIGIPLRLDSSWAAENSRFSTNIPSVMSIALYSSIGAIDGVESIDGINTSGQKYYNILSALNAKTTQYQPEDISLVEVLISSLLEQVANAIRIYGVVFNFNPRNRRIPYDLVRAMGVSPDSLDDFGDVSAFRMRLNRLLTVANGIKFLKDINIFKRSWELFSRIFIDENSSMGQYYVMRPAGYWLLDESSDENRAKWIQRESLISADDLLDDIETIIRTLLNSSIFNYIYTDILNYQSKKGGELLTFAYVPELVQVFGVYDAGILNQIHNMCWGGVDLSDYRIIDKVLENRIVSTNPVLASGPADLASCNGSQVLDQIYTDQPTFDDNVDALAFKSAYYNVILNEALNKYTAQGVYIPDHPVLKVVIYRTDDTPLELVSNNIGGASSAVTTVYSRVEQFTKFKVYPLLTALDDQGKRSSLIGSLNFFTVVEPKQLENMFNYYYLGLYNVDVKDVKSFQ